MNSTDLNTGDTIKHRTSQSVFFDNPGLSTDAKFHKNSERDTKTNPKIRVSLSLALACGKNRYSDLDKFRSDVG